VSTGSRRVTLLDAAGRAGAAGRERAAFTLSRKLVLFDHFRIPYALDPDLRRDGLEQLLSADSGGALLWTSEIDGPASSAVVRGTDGGPDVPLHARVLPDHQATVRLARLGGRWDRARSLIAPDGEVVGSIWQRENGDVFLPFDPDEVILNYWSERYLEITAPGVARKLKRTMMRAYYLVRPLMPRRLQIWLRRRYTRVQAGSCFPRWPIESGLHDFFDLVVEILAQLAEAPVPTIAPWPAGYAWALVLTHDVEHAGGWTVVEPIVELERAHGVRSSFNLVPRRYEVEPERVSALSAEGFEIGVHGLHHDGRDLASLAELNARLPEMHAARSRWNASGFRSPSLHRRWEWMSLLGFEYDSSYPDTDPFEPQAGGCCSWLPFFNRATVELPLTLTQDHTLFVLLRHPDEAAWVQKTEFLRSRGAMALINTHPDYLVEPRIFRAYARFLDRFAADSSAWRALPRDVSSWWRRRANSSIEWDGQDWRIVGPASEDGAIRLVGGAADGFERAHAQADRSMTANRQVTRPVAHRKDLWLTRPPT